MSGCIKSSVSKYSLSAAGHSPRARVAMARGGLLEVISSILVPRVRLPLSSRGKAETTNGIS
eukprot:2683795-Prymnesium_polylepis.1